MNAIDDSAAEGDPSAKASKATGDTWSEKIKTIGGLVAVTVGVIAVGTIAIIALIKNTETSATIASAAGGVIATIVGAYFGVKVGSDQSKTAIDGQKAIGAKAEVYAAHLPPDAAPGIIAMAERAAERAVSR